MATNLSKSASPSEPRELAVTIVDGLFGYTVEFSNDKVSHAADYKLVEGILWAARASAAPLNQTASGSTSNLWEQ